MTAEAQVVVQDPNELAFANSIGLILETVFWVPNEMDPDETRMGHWFCKNKRTLSVNAIMSGLAKNVVLGSTFVLRL